MAASTLMMMRLSTAGIIVAPPCESNAYFLGPLKDSSQKNVARKRKNPRTSQSLLTKKCCLQKEKSRSILEVSFPTEIRYCDSVDNLDDSDGGDS